MNKYIIPKKQKQNKTKTKQIDIQANKQTKKQRSSICKRMETYIHLKHFIKSWAFQYILFSFFFPQLMETGENGASGALAQRHANMGNNIENENATRQLQNMAERNALDNLLKPNLATKKCRVQVSISELRKNKLHSPVRNDSLLMQEQI